MLNGVSEIEEEVVETFNHEIEEDCVVYVAVGKSNTSMEALSWAINNFTTNNSILYLIHVFPQIKHIPNPLGVGMVPRNQVSGEQVEIYMDQERSKRRQLLQKFIHSCSLNNVKVDTILIESDFVAKAILDLIPILHITNLVLGANKHHLRKSKSKKGSGSGVADEVVKSAPESCKVRIICEGKEVINDDDQIDHSSPTASPQIFNSAATTTTATNKENDSVLCKCFKPKFK